MGRNYDDENDEEKNALEYAELKQFLDDKSLSLVTRNAAADGNESLNILRYYYTGKGKPRVISLYTELTSLKEMSSESVMEYIIRAEIHHREMPGKYLVMCLWQWC